MLFQSISLCWIYFLLFIKSQITTICGIDAIPRIFEDYIEKAVQLPGIPGVGKCGFKSQFAQSLCKSKDESKKRTNQRWDISKVLWEEEEAGTHGSQSKSACPPGRCITLANM